MKEGNVSFIGAGDLYIDRLTSAGVSTGLVKLGNATKFSLKVDSETKKQLARGRANSGQTLASVTKITGSTISMSLNQLDHQVLAAAFLGDSVAMTGAGGAIVEEPIEAVLDKFVELAHGNVTTVVVKDAATGLITYVANTDYEVNARLGMIKALSTGAIIEGEDLEVNYTWAAETGYRITGATKAVVKAKLVLDGKNDYDGEAVVVKVWEAQLTPSSEIDFLADDFAEIQLEGDMLTPAGKSWPFEVV